MSMHMSTYQTNTKVQEQPCSHKLVAGMPVDMFRHVVSSVFGASTNRWCKLLLLKCTMCLLTCWI